MKPVDRLFEFSLLGMVASGYFAVAGSGYLDTSTVLLTAIALVLRAIMITGLWRPHFPTVVVNIATLLYIVFYPVDYVFISKEFLASTIHLIFFLAVTRVLTAETERDYTFVKMIAFLELLAACVLSGRSNFFLFMAMYLVFAVGAFTSAEIRKSGRSEARVARSGFNGLQARLAALGLFVSFGVLILTAGLFFFLPRTARAAFQHLVSERYHLPGFSSEVRLGQLGEIKQQSTTLMHVRFITPNGALLNNLRWRGTALSRFDGKRWYSPPTGRFELVKPEQSTLARLLTEDQRPFPSATRIAYEVHQKDFGTDTLFVAGIPEFLSAPFAIHRRPNTSTLRAGSSTGNGINFVAHAYLEQGAEFKVPASPLPPMVRKENVELPPLDPRIPRLAAAMSAGAISDLAKAQAVERSLRNEYGYTLTLLDREVPDPLAYFLFDRRKGHCEYFASAMAVLLRTLDIPARVVTGFQSGIFNPISGLQMIRSSDAHSWVEAYINARGWTSFDPTPPDTSGISQNFATRLSLYFDAAETFWQDWVLNYDLDHQLQLATRMQDSHGPSSSWTDSIAAWGRDIGRGAKEFLQRYGAPLAAALIVIALVIFYGPAARKAWLARKRMLRLQRGQALASDATLLYERMLKVLEKRGVEKPAWVTAGEFARMVPGPELTPLVQDLTAAYYELRFGGRSEAAPRMVALIERLEKR